MQGLGVYKAGRQVSKDVAVTMVQDFCTLAVRLQPVSRILYIKHDSSPKWHDPHAMHLLQRQRSTLLQITSSLITHQAVTAIDQSLK